MNIEKSIALVATLRCLLSSVKFSSITENWTRQNWTSFKFSFQIWKQCLVGIRLPLLMNRPTYILCTLIDTWISKLIRNLMEIMFNPCSELRWSLENPVSQIHTPHLLIGSPGIFSDILRFVQMLKIEWGAENGKLPHLFIPSKTATWVPEFAMEDLHLGRIAALVPEFAVKDLPLGRTLMTMMICIHTVKNSVITWFFLFNTSALS